MDQPLARSTSLPLRKCGVSLPGKMTARTRGPRSGSVIRVAIELGVGGSIGSQLATVRSGRIHTMEPEQKKRLSGARAFVARMSVLALILWIFGSVLSPFDDREFDPTVWRQHAGSSDWQSPRGRMYEDLRRSLLRDRPMREEVIQLLGPPDTSGQGAALRYTLGAWSGFRIDYDTMVVTFDESQRVSSVHRFQG